MKTFLVAAIPSLAMLLGCGSESATPTAAADESADTLANKSTEELISGLAASLAKRSEDRSNAIDDPYPIFVEGPLYGGVELEAKMLRAAAKVNDDLDAVKVYGWAQELWRMYRNEETPSRLDHMSNFRSIYAKFVCDEQGIQLAIFRDRESAVPYYE